MYSSRGTNSNYLQIPLLQSMNRLVYSGSCLVSSSTDCLDCRSVPLKLPVLLFQLISPAVVVVYRILNPYVRNLSFKYKGLWFSVMINRSTVCCIWVMKWSSSGLFLCTSNTTIIWANLMMADNLGVWSSPVHRVLSSAVRPTSTSNTPVALTNPFWYGSFSNRWSNMLIHHVKRVRSNSVQGGVSAGDAAWGLGSVGEPMRTHDSPSFISLLERWRNGWLELSSSVSGRWANATHQLIIWRWRPVNWYGRAMGAWYVRYIMQMIRCHACWYRCLVSVSIRAWNGRRGFFSTSFRLISNRANEPHSTVMINCWAIFVTRVKLWHMVCNIALTSRGNSIQIAMLLKSNPFKRRGHWVRFNYGLTSKLSGVVTLCWLARIWACCWMIWCDRCCLVSSLARWPAKPLAELWVLTESTGRISKHSCWLPWVNYRWHSTFSRHGYR